MMEIVDDQVSEAMEEVKYTRNVDKSVLDVFWKLVEPSPEVRIDAALTIIRILDEKQGSFSINHANTACPDLKYSVERLVKGISSCRRAARQGFSLTLTEILKNFRAVTAKEVLSLLDQHLPLSNKQEKCPVVIGQLLTYSAIIRSGRLKADLESLSTVVLQLFLLSLGKSYIQEATYKLMSHLFTEISEENFKEYVWPNMKKKLSCSWGTCSPDILWFLLLCLRMFPNTVTSKFLLKNWGSEEILCSENFEHLQKMVKQSTSVHPQFSPVCSELLHSMLQKKKLKKIWTPVFDDVLFKSDQNEKTYMGFKVIKAALSEAKDDVKLVSSILSSNFSSVLTRCLLSCNHPMNSAASELAEFLAKFVKECRDPRVQVLVLKAVIQPPGTMLLDQILHMIHVTAIISNFSYEAVKLYCEFLQRMILEKSSNEEDPELVNWRRGRACSQVGNLVSHLTVIGDIEWRLEITKFLFLHSFFEIKEATEHIDPNWIPHYDSEIYSLHPAVQLMCRYSFNRALDSINRKFGSSYNSSLGCEVGVLKSVAEFADELLQLSGKVIPVQPLEKIQKPWNNVMKTVQKLTKQIKKNGKTVETEAFQILFLQLGLMLFSGEDYIPGTLEELQVCCKKAMKHRKGEGSDDDASWIQVIVDIMLSLIMKESRHMRRVVCAFFSLINSSMTREAIQQILDVIHPETEDILAEGSEDEDEDVEFASGSSSGGESEKEDGGGTKNVKNQEELSKLKLKVQEALGAAADASDAESDVLTDSEMAKFDEALSAAFRSQKKAGHLQFSPEQQTLMHFRTKCLDLISSYLKTEPPMSIVLQCILPILAAYRFGLQSRHQEPLADTAHSTLELLVRTKKFQNYDGVEFDEIRKILKYLIDVANKASNTAISVRLLNSLCVYMVLCERRLELSYQQKEIKAKKSVLPSCLDQFRTAFSVFVNDSRSCLMPQIFIALMNACPETAWSFVKPVQEGAFDPNVRLFRRAQCLGLLVSCFRFSKGQIFVSSEMWHDVFETVVPKAIEALSSMLQSQSNIKPMYTAELFEVLIAILEFKKEKCGEDLDTKYKEELHKVLVELSGVLKKKLAPQGKRSLNRLIRLLSREVAVVRRSEKKRKVPEYDDDEDSDSEMDRKIKQQNDDDKKFELEQYNKGKKIKLEQENDAKKIKLENVDDSKNGVSSTSSEDEMSDT